MNTDGMKHDEDMALFIEQQRSENTKRAYRQDLAHWSVFLGDRELTEDIVLEYRDHLEATLSKNSAVRRFSTVRSFYRWSGYGGAFERIKGVVRTKNWVPVVPDAQDVSAILNVCTNATDRAILACLANGLRAQEVCDIRSSDLSYTQGSWVLRVIGKGDKLRLVPLNDETVAALSTLINGRDGRVFPRLNRRRVHYVVAKWAKTAGVEGIHPHSLRHDYATRLIRSGVDVSFVQRLLGHSSLETTSLYIGLNLGDLIEAAQKDPRHGAQKAPLRAVG